MSVKYLFIQVVVFALPGVNFVLLHLDDVHEPPYLEVVGVGGAAVRHFVARGLSLRGQGLLLRALGSTSLAYVFRVVEVLMFDGRVGGGRWVVVDLG